MQSFPLGQKFDSSGKPLNGGLAYFRLSGTTTAATVYADAGLVTPLAYPIVANSAGRFPELVYLNPAHAHRYNLYAAGDGLGTSLESADPINTPEGGGGIDGATLNLNSLPGDRIADGGIEAKLGYTPENATTVFPNVRLANMATHTIKGNKESGTGPPEDLSGTQATALLDALVGDSGSGGTKGLAPAPASGDGAAKKYLRADATWGMGFFETAFAGWAAGDHNAAVAHGLGVKPNRVEIYLKCTTAQLGHAVGDEVRVAGASSNNGLEAWIVDATNVGYVVGAAGISILNGTTGGITTVTAADWSIVLRAWAP